MPFLCRISTYYYVNCQTLPCAPRVKCTSISRNKSEHANTFNPCCRSGCKCFFFLFSQCRVFLSTWNGVRHHFKPPDNSIKWNSLEQERMGKIKQCRVVCIRWCCAFSWFREGILPLLTDWLVRPTFDPWCGYTRKANSEPIWATWGCHFILLEIQF